MQQNTAGSGEGHIQVRRVRKWVVQYPPTFDFIMQSDRAICNVRGMAERLGGRPLRYLRSSAPDFYKMYD
jgi:hypothetical protein